MNLETKISSSEFCFYMSAVKSFYDRISWASSALRHYTSEKVDAHTDKKKGTSREVEESTHGILKLWILPLKVFHSTSSKILANF